MLFSYRQGLKPVKNRIQTDSMDDDLRNGLWNALDIACWSLAAKSYPVDWADNASFLQLAQTLWRDHYKEPLDTIPGFPESALKEVKRKYFAAKWYEVYDLVEFVANNVLTMTISSEKFQNYCNYIMERELSGYRFVRGIITPITSETELAEIEKGLASTSEPVRTHLQRALELFSDRKTPDYRNSVKESISAVESLAQLVAGKGASLGDALKKVGDKIELHPALKDAFDKLYGYTSNADGIRHALSGVPTLSSEDALFMLVSCSAFVNYLTVKAEKAGIKT